MMLYKIFLVCIFVSIICDGYAHNLERRCSRQRSKLVREIFIKALLPKYYKHSVPIPNDCKYSPLNDLYYNHENNKTKLDTSRWKCEYCGKIFLEEKFLDLHFTNKHNDSLNMGSNGRIYCLADLCKIFRCDVLQNTKLTFKKQACNEGAMQTLKQNCDDVVHDCVPRSASRATQNQLANELNKELCSYLTCSKYHELPTFMNQGPSFVKIFLLVVFVGLCIIAYGVLNHTDLIYNENESVQNNVIDDDLLEETSDEVETLTAAYSTQKLIPDDIRLRKPHIN